VNKSCLVQIASTSITFLMWSWASTRTAQQRVQGCAPLLVRAKERLDAPPQYLSDEKVSTRLSEMTTKEAEFSQKQADWLMRLAGETRDPQLRAQLVIMSKAWIDQGANTRLRFKLIDAWRRYSSRPFPG
jgi:hypothetical protein